MVRGRAWKLGWLGTIAALAVLPISCGGDEPTIPANVADASVNDATTPDGPAPPVYGIDTRPSNTT
jgi:hypothetical protein